MIKAWSPASLQQAIELLRNGQLVAFPTETVYGLGADASNPQAVARIFAAKGRPANHPVIVHLADASRLHEWAINIPPGAYQLIQHYWPGPLTLILNRAPGVPDAVTGGQNTVGVRCPAHPVAHALLEAFSAAGGSGALAAPSANRFGRISPSQAQHVANEFGDLVPLIIDGGECDVGIESTIIDLSRGNPVLLRPGHITAQEIESVLGQPVLLPDGSRADRAVNGVSESSGSATAPRTDALREPDAHSTSAGRAATNETSQATPRVSGSLKAHYAPITPMELIPADALLARLAYWQQAGVRVGVWSRTLSPPANANPESLVWRQAPQNAQLYARQLYGTLHQFDAANLHRILVETPPEGGRWAAIHDRLGRAVAGSGGIT